MNTYTKSVSAQQLMASIVEELQLPAIAVRMTRTGISTANARITPSIRGVKIEQVGKDVEYVDSYVMAANIHRLLTDKVMLREEIRMQVRKILHMRMGERYSSIKFKIEDERVLVKTEDGMFRINVESFNVTKLIGNVWIIQTSDEYIRRQVEMLHGTLVQVGLM